MQPRIERLEEPSCLAQLLAIEQASFPDPMSELLLRDTLSHTSNLCFVVYETDTPIGFVIVQGIGDTADIVSIAIAPSHRRRGYARALLSHTLIALSQEGMRECFLEVRKSNAPALALYHALGFQQIGLRKNYYNHPTEHAVICKWEEETCIS